MSNNNEAEKQNVALKFTKSNVQNEPYYLLTLQDNNGEEHQIKIDKDSDPSKLAFDFCKKYDLDFDSMKYLKKTIKSVLKKYEIPIEKKNFLNINNNPIQEVDEENYFFDTPKTKNKSQKNKNIADEKEEKSNNNLDSNSQIIQLNPSFSSCQKNLLQSKNMKLKTNVNKYMTYSKYININNADVTKEIISPTIEKTIAKLTENSNYKIKNNSSDFLLNKGNKKSIVTKNNINSYDDLNSFCSSNTINLFNNYNFIMKTEHPKDNTYFNNNEINSNKKHFTINYSENETICKEMSKKDSIIKNIKKKSIAEKNLINSNKNSTNNSKFNIRKRKSGYLRAKNIYKDKTVNFNGTKVISTTINLEKDSNNKIYNYKTIQNISPTMIYSPDNYKSNNEKESRVKNTQVRKILYINENKRKSQIHSLKAKTPRSLDNKNNNNQKLINNNNANKITNKNNSIFSPKSESETAINLLNNDISWKNNKKFNKTIISKNFNKKSVCDISKTFNLTKKNNKIINTNPFMSYININSKNSDVKNQNIIKTRNSFIQKKFNYQKNTK